MKIGAGGVSSESRGMIGPKVRKACLALVSALTLGALVVAACAPAATPPPAATSTAKPAAAAATATSKPAPSPAPPTPTPKPEKVVLTIPAVGFSDIAHMVALKKGFWRDEGFDVDKQVMKSGVAVKAVIAGELEYTGSIGSALRAAAQGQPIKGVVAVQTAPPYVLLARPDIKAATDLKGKAVGVDSVQGTTHIMMKTILNHFRMDPDKDVVAVALGDNPTRLQALQGGAVQAVVVDLGFGIQGESLGMKILANAAEITERISGGVATSDKRIKENPDKVLRFVRASVKALKYVRDPRNKDEMVQLMVDDLKFSKDVALWAYDLGIKGFSEDGTVSDTALKAEIDDAKAVSGITREVPVSLVFDSSFVRSLVNR